MSDTTAYITAVKIYIQALTDKNLEAIVGLYADNATLEDPVGSDLIKGIEGIREFYANALAMNVKAELTGPVRAAGMEAVFPFKLEVPSGEGAMFIDVIDLFRFDAGGKVASMRAFWGPDNCISS